jgi:hypothetical protein
MKLKREETKRYMAQENINKLKEHEYLETRP